MSALWSKLKPRLVPLFHPADHLGRGLGLLALIAIAPFAWYYFRVVDIGPAFERDTKAFFTQWSANRQDWITLEPAELTEALRTGVMDPFEEMTIRTALVRYRQRAELPELFDAKLAEWSRGSWTLPTRDQWVAAFEAADKRWISARQVAVSNRTGERLVSSSKIERTAAGGIRISFPNAVMTSDVGSRIRLTFAHDGKKPYGSPRTLWAVNSPGLSPSRSQRPLVEFIRAPDGTPAVVYTLDMSVEPGWLAAESRAVVIDFIGEMPPVESLLAVVADDSPLLPVK